MDSEVSYGILQTKDYINFHLAQSNGQLLQIPEGIKVLSGCLPGDEIKFDSESKCYKVIHSANHNKLIGILELTSKTRYGITSRGYSKYLWRPMNPAYPPFIVGSSQKVLTKNMLCSINLKGSLWNPSLSTFPEGEIVEYFGYLGNWEAERRALIEHWCPWRNSEKNVSEVNSVNNNNQNRYVIGNSDYEKMNTFHIDPPGCQDVDDILTIYYDNERNIVRCIITISDVAEYIKNQKSQILETAQNIGSTFYNENGGVLVSMLPKKLSDEYLSLHDNGRDKYGISLDIEIGCEVGEGSKILKQSLYLSKILKSVVKTYTYETFLEDTQQNCRNYKIVYEILEKTLGRCATKYNGKETGIDGIHAFVETTMLYYNWYVGNFLATTAVVENIPYRAQGALQSERLKDWQERIPTFTFPESAQYVLGRDSKHSTLGLKNYCHASSPIRRFCDLWIQIQLHSILNIQSLGNIMKLPDEFVDSLVNKLNDRSKSQKKFSKQLGLIAMMEKGVRDFHGICLEWRECENGLFWKGKFLVEEIGMVYTIRQLGDKKRTSVGSKVALKVGIHMTEAVWKRRFVFSLFDSSLNEDIHK